MIHTRLRSCSCVPSLRARGCFLLTFAFAARLPAAVPAGAPEGEVVNLSPFVVSTTQDKGYAATQTLSGTRLKTDVRDTPVSLSILTEEFMNDIAATNIESMADFLPSTSVYALNGAQDSGNAAKAGDTLSIRGFESSSRTRNFFQTIGFNDRYNTERITLSRGPNSLLFGIGNPGGAVQIATNQAHFRGPTGSLNYQYDSFGSHRVSLDQNLTLIPQRLAVRADVLYEDAKGFREPTYDRKDGLYLTTTIHPFDPAGRTQVRLNYEHGKWDRVAARPWAPFDLYSTWVAAGTPLYNNRTAPRPGTTPSLANPFIRMENVFVDIKAQTALPTYYAALQTGRYNSYVRAAGPIVNGVEVTKSSLTSDFVSLNPLDILRRHFGGSQAQLDAWLAGLGPLRSIPEAWAGGKSVTIPMETFFSGNLDTYVRKFDTATVFLEQRVGRNLFIEAAANFEKSDVDNLTMMRDSDYSIQYDPNLYLPDGAPNPYVGMPYVGQLAFATQSIDENDTQEYRLTTSYTLDLRSRKLFRALDLGRHHLSLLVNRYESESATRQDRPKIVEWMGQPLSALRLTVRNLNMRSRYYLVPGATPYITEPWVPVAGEGQVAKSEWIQFTASFDDLKIDSLALATQSFFLKDRLVLTAGWRRDHLTQYGTNAVLYTAANANPARGIYEGEVDLGATRAARVLMSDQRWENHSVGGVFHLHRALGVFANFATNASGEVVRYDINYQPISPVTGEGFDFGLKFSLFQDRLVGSVTRFETKQKDSFINGPALLGRGVWGTALPQILRVIDPAEQARRESISAAWVPLYDLTAEGTELELVWNPWRNLRLRATYSEMSNQISRFAEDLDGYLARERGEWEAFVARNYDPNFTGPVNPAAPTPAEQLKRDADIVRSSLAEIDAEMPLKRALNGQEDLGLSKYAISFAGSYQFGDDTFLRGWSVGTSLRVKGPVLLAYETDAAGVPNLGNALRADGPQSWDVFVGYRRKLLKNRLQWSVQANVRNVLNDDDPTYLLGMWDRTTQSFVRTRNLMKEPRSLVLRSSLAW